MHLSFSSILCFIFAGYVINTIWTLAEIFIPPECGRGEKCYASYLSSDPSLNLILFTSLTENPYYDGSAAESASRIHTALKFDYRNPSTLYVTSCIYYLLKIVCTLNFCMIFPVI